MVSGDLAANQGTVHHQQLGPFILTVACDLAFESMLPSMASAVVQGRLSITSMALVIQYFPTHSSADMVAVVGADARNPSHGPRSWVSGAGRER